MRLGNQLGIKSVFLCLKFNCVRFLERSVEFFSFRGAGVAGRGTGWIERSWEGVLETSYIFS